MKNGYDQFFRNARKAASGEAPKAAKKSSSKNARFDLTPEQLEERLRRRVNIQSRKKPRRGYPWKTALISAAGVLLTGWAMVNAEQVENWLKNVEVVWLGAAVAAEPAPAPTAPAEPASAPAKAESREPSSSEIDHLSKLTERGKELDAREQELVRQESELARMKEELERRLKELDEMRSRISEMLQDRVKADDQKVDTLVQMYSNMKPSQAAKIFETLDEDLAVEILGRMKKKSAADIMNLLKAEKAQTFSEKYAGYKRK